MNEEIELPWEIEYTNLVLFTDLFMLQSTRNNLKIMSEISDEFSDTVVDVKSQLLVLELRYCDKIKTELNKKYRLN